MDNYNLSVHSNSKGNLLKAVYTSGETTHFIKTGRLQVRDFPGCWGIEPVVEAICYEVGRKLGLDVAKQMLMSIHGTRYNKDFNTLICDSPDFRNGRALIYLQFLYVENYENIEFEKLCRNTGCGDSLIDMLAFDLIIMNEDRHNNNIGFLMDDDGIITLAPIYDNGYSLLYDDIKGMLGDFKAAVRHCMCNAPLYQESFLAAERMFIRYSKIYTPTINLDVTREEISEAVMLVKFVYQHHFQDTNNIVLKDVWWNRVVDFIMWRIEYVRDLRDNMEE